MINNYNGTFDFKNTHGHGKNHLLFWGGLNSNINTLGLYKFWQNW